MPKRRQFRSRPDRTGNKPWFVISRVITRDPFGKLCRPQIHIISLIRDPKFGQHNLAAAKAVRLDHIAADIEERLMHRLDRIRPRVKQILRAVLKRRAAPFVDRQIERLQIRPHRTVKDDDFFF